MTTVDEKTTVSELRAIRDWEIYDGMKKWTPCRVSWKYPNFVITKKGTSKESFLDNEDEIGKAGLPVKVRVAQKYKYKEEEDQEQQDSKDR